MPLKRYGLIAITSNLTQHDEFDPFDKRFNKQFFMRISASCANSRYESIFNATHELINHKMHPKAKLIIPLRKAHLENLTFRIRLKQFLIGLLDDEYEIILFAHHTEMLSNAIGLNKCEPLFTKMIANDLFLTHADFSNHLYGLNSLAEREYMQDVFAGRNKKESLSHLDLIEQCANYRDTPQSPKNYKEQPKIKKSKELIFTPRVFPSNNKIVNDVMDCFMFVLFCFALYKLLCVKPKRAKYKNNRG